MLKIILIRPGSTEFDRQGRILGTLDVPLSNEGTSEVAAAIDALRGEAIETVYCSPGKSAVETAEALAETFDVKCKPLKMLQNVDHGLWQGLLVEEVKRKQPRVFKQWQEHPETVCPPEGEMLTAALQRVAAVLGKLLKKHKEGTIALVVPEPLAGLVRAFLRQTELADVWKMGGGCGSWEVIPVESESLLQTGAVLGEGTAPH